MKKARYDLERVYYLNKYNETAAYANQNIQIQGVRQQLQGLNAEKGSYMREVREFTDSVRSEESKKYQQYEKWSKLAKTCLLAELGIFLIGIAEEYIFKYVPRQLNLLFSLLELLILVLIFVVIPIAFVVSKILDIAYGKIYADYTQQIAMRVDTAGSDFESLVGVYYDKIDNLYLSSLDPASRELVLLRRQQAEQTRQMVKLAEEQKRIAKQQLAEAKRTSQSTQQLLDIEKERERRRRGW